MLHIACAFINPRLHYAAAFIFERVLRLPYALHLGKPEGVEFCLSYGAESGPFVPRSGFLEAPGPVSTLPALREQQGLPFIFEVDEVTGGFDFDVFAAVFFCLARCEEVVIDARDAHGRFEARSSMFQPWHEQPYVDRWIRLFGKWLLEEGLVSTIAAPEAKWINTLDIDIAYAYRGRSLLRRLGATAKDLKAGHSARRAERRSVLAGKQPDPYDTYDLWLGAAAKAHTNLAFVLSGGKGKYDIGLDIQHHDVRSLLRRLAAPVELGIHPSYESSVQPELINHEMSALRAASGQVILSSRQHFLRMRLPHTYRMLQAAGIKRDYSMGYADAVGFRAGTAYAFPFFDLLENESLNIELQPLIAMDSAMKAYMALEPNAALEKLMALWTAICESGGSMVTVWHNHSLSGRDGWEQWQHLYPDFAERLQHPR